MSMIIVMRGCNDERSFNMAVRFAVQNNFNRLPVPFRADSEGFKELYNVTTREIKQLLRRGKSIVVHGLFEGREGIDKIKELALKERIHFSVYTNVPRQGYVPISGKEWQSYPDELELDTYALTHLGLKDFINERKEIDNE